jgi:hypothetical protein
MGLFNFFSKKEDTSINNQKPVIAKTIETFCDIVSSGEQINILKILNLPLGIFTKATQTQINSNPEDIRDGVVDVYFVNNLQLFGIFDACVHKILKDGSKLYFIYTTTSNSELVSTFANTLYEKLGIGFFDERKFNSFRDFDNIDNISKGFCSSKREECGTIWSLKNNLTLHLKYLINPLRQFVLQIDENIIVESENYSREKSIAEFINFDLSQLIENSVELERITEDGHVKLVDYISILPETFFDVFDTIKIKIFSANKIFDKDIQTHITFLTSDNKISLEDISKVTNKLALIYGKDNTNSDSLKNYEINDINEYSKWLGRSYTFNKEHKLWDDKNPFENFLYGVSARYDINDDGLTLSIDSFNEMLKFIEKKKHIH